MHDENRAWTKPTLFGAKGYQAGLPSIELPPGQLYSLAIEPRLACLRARLTGFELPGGALSPGVVLSAYADDVLADTLFLYQKAASANIWREMHGKHRGYTWVQNRENNLSMARLDRFYCFKHHFSVFKGCRILPSGFSDLLFHNPTTASTMQIILFSF